MPDGALLPLPSTEAPSIEAEILAGLRRDQKTLPAKLFYDEAGCRLFNRITGLDEYYLTRTELALLADCAGEIVAGLPADTLVEYGASDEIKADFLLARGRVRTYVPIDIAPSGLQAIADRLARTRPDLSVVPLVADFTKPLTLPPALADARPCGFFPGSTIGNFEPDMVVTFLRRVADTLTAPNGATGGATRLVVGIDLRKDPDRLLPAYDDASGVTAAFNKNILLHVNRIAEADFDPDDFRHRAAWNDAHSRIEMHLVSTRRHAVHVAGEPIRFEAGETIHTENSYKHTSDAFLALARRGGWTGVGLWTDPDRLFGIHLLEASS